MKRPTPGPQSLRLPAQPSSQFFSLVVASSESTLFLLRPRPDKLGPLAIVGKDGKIQGDCPLKHHWMYAPVSADSSRALPSRRVSRTPRPRTWKRSTPSRSRRTPPSTI